MDYIIKLPPVKGLDSILVIVDWYSGMAHLNPSKKKQTAEQVWADCWQGAWKLTKLPQEIITDQGTVFTSEWWESTMAKEQIDHCMTTAYRPQANGKAERTNQELKQYLPKYANHQQNNWPELVLLAEYAYNTTKTQGTDFTPYQMVYGKTLIIHEAPGEPSQAAVDKIRKVAYKNLLYSQVLLQEQRNKRRKPATELRPKDKAYVQKRGARRDQPSASLDDKYWGPFPVKQKVGQSSYKLELPSQTQINPVFNSNVFKRAATDPFPGQQLLNKPPPNIIEGQEEYKVKAILDKKVKQNGVQYRVKWKGYEETTWEPMSNL